ncbi:MAG: flippase [Candidatus Edwardsbacteria bacterium]|nr:flippase [Candidatus Edwardsbacteria bacterium]
MKSDKKIVIENMASLFLVQGANYILPLITFPYLVRVLGLDRFGLIAFSIAFVQYFVIFVDYGFNLTATREISINRNNIDSISRIFCNVMIIKFILVLISFLLYLSLILYFPMFRTEIYLYLIGFLAVLGNLLFPVWFFQGIENIKVVAIFNLLSKLIFTLTIFVFVKEQSDYLKVMALQTGGVLFSGIGAFLYAFIKYPIKVVLPKYYDIKTDLRNGWYVFATILSSTLVNNSNIFILGLFADNKIVGMFAIADKIIRVFINICVPISNAIFPMVSKLFSESKEVALTLIRKVLVYGGGVFVLLCIVLFLSADSLVFLISGESNIDISILIRIMSIVPLSIFIDNLYGTQVLININRSDQFMKAVLFPGIASIILSFIFVPMWKYYATAIIFVFSELLILFMMIYYVRKNKIYLIKKGIA